MPERTLLVLAPNWLGDAIMALPAVGDVRRASPGTRLVVAARPSVAPLYTLAPAVDEVITLAWRGKAGDRAALPADAARLRAVNASAAILLPNSFGSAWLARQAGVGERWGYAADLRRFLLTRAIARPKGSRHQGAYYQHLTQALGFASGPLEPALEVPADVIEQARQLLRGEGWQPERPLLVVAPGAAYGTAKRWEPAYFAQLVTREVAARGAQCVLVGAGADAETTGWIRDAVDAHTRAAVIDLTGRTSLVALAGVLRLASACVSNDSGAMHLAAGVGAPVVALFGPTREYETAPLTRAGGRAEVLLEPVFCRPCMLRTCPIDHRCMTRLAPERVAAAVEQLMAGAAR